MRPLVLTALLAACGSSPKKAAPAPAVVVPERAATGTDPLLSLLPAGYDAVAELDLARLKQNRAAGAVLDVVPEREVMGFDPLRDVDLALAAVYDLGGDQAATLFVLRGAGLTEARILDASRLDDRTVLVGPEALRSRATAQPAEPDAAFLALRAQAMPSKAKSASLRLTARLSKAARIAAAGRLGVDEVPGTISLWFDVEDDAALVAVLGGDDEANARRLAAGVEDSRERLAQWLPRPVLSGIEIGVHGSLTRVVWIVPPRRLEKWVKELRDQVQGGQS
jgi:hypothetical protein